MCKGEGRHLTTSSQDITPGRPSDPRRMLGADGTRDLRGRACGQPDLAAPPRPLPYSYGQGALGLASSPRRGGTEAVSPRAAVIAQRCWVQPPSVVPCSIMSRADVPAGTPGQEGREEDSPEAGDPADRLRTSSRPRQRIRLNVTVKRPPMCSAGRTGVRAPLGRNCQRKLQAPAHPHPGPVPCPARASFFSWVVQSVRVCSELCKKNTPPETVPNHLNPSVSCKGFDHTRDRIEKSSS